MKSVQRRFGTFMKRSDNEEDVQTVLAEFKAVDGMLDSLIKDIKAWRNAWEDVLKLQYDASEAFANLYKQIEATGDESGGQATHQPAQTPAKLMQKCLGLQKEYSDEKTDLFQEINMIDNKLLRPAEQAKQHTKLLQKTLKHRDNVKLDYERYLSRAEHARKKEARTPKEEMNLQQHEAKLAQSQIDYQTADEQVKQTFPPVSAAIVTLLPHLLAIQIMLQTTLVGQLYTVLDAYTKKFGFPNPAPSDADIISTWDNEFTSFRKELEGGIPLIAHGKAVHLSMALPPEKANTLTGLGIRNKVMNRKTSNQGTMPFRPSGTSSQDSASQIDQETEEVAPPKPPRPGTMPPSPGPGMRSPSADFLNKPHMGSNVMSPGLRSPSNGIYGSNIASPGLRSPSNGSYGSKPPPPYPTSLSPAFPYQTPSQASGDATPPSRYQTPSPIPSATSNAAGADYFGIRRPSGTPSIASSAASIAAGKKKPPPPVPAKRLPSMQSQFVTALYDFEGQNPSDLAFSEGDRIKVVKKTDSTDDWWDGELKGKNGSFPANYVQL